MQTICNFVNKIVKLYNIILIIDRNRKQKAQKSSCPNPAISKEKKIMALTPKDKVKASARGSKGTTKALPPASDNQSEKAGGRSSLSLTIEDKKASEAKSAGIQLYKPQLLHDNRPVGPNDFTISEIVSISGNRPIGASTLHISETYGTVGNRPIEASDFEVVATLGRRPIGSSAMQVSEMFSMSGARPIAMSTLHIDEVYSTMGGNRPIASNEIDDSSTLMGFLD